MLILSGNVTEPITLLEVKKYLRVVGIADDDEVQRLTDSVIEDGQKYTNRQFGTATYILFLENIYDGFKFPKNPIQSIEKIEILDEDNNYIVLDSSKYYLYEELEIGRLKILENISLINHKKAIKITFICGYEVVPEPIKTWIKYKTMCLFDGKEENINKYVDNMIGKYRIGPLG